MPLLSRRARRRRRNTVLIAVGVVVAAELGAQLLAPVIDPVPIDWPNATTQLKHDQLELLSGREVDGTNIPVTFVGDTAAQQAFLPATFAAVDPEGRLSYNAALPGGVPGVVRPWLLDEVLPQLEPGIVVWGVGLSDITTGYGEAEVAAYEGSLGAKDGILAEIERSAAEVSDLVRLRPALRDPSMLAGDRRDEIVLDTELSETLLGPGGQRLGYQPGPTDIGEAEARRLFGDFEIDEADLADITDTITKLRRRGKQVVLVELPTSPQVVELLPNGEQDLAMFRDTLDQLSTATSTQVYRAAGPFGPDDFVDHVHVTEETAEVITGQVAAALPTLDLADGAAIFSDGANLDQVIAQVDETAVKRELTTLSQALDAMDEGCNQPERWMEDTVSVAEAIDRTAATVIDLDDDRFRTSTVARQASSSVGGRVLLQAGCERGTTIGPPPRADLFQARAARLVSSYERMDAALAPADQPPASKLWMHPDQVFHLEGLRDDEANEQPVDVAFIGSSETRSGIDPALFTELTGRSSTNLGMNRATPEVSRLWLEDVLTASRPEVVVWAVSPSDLIATCGLEVRETIYSAPARVRDELFSGISWAPSTSPFDLILGPPDRAIYDITPTYEAAFAAFEPDSRGTVVDNTGADPETAALELQAYGPRTSAGQDCSERFDLMADEVRSLTESGQSVIVVGLPTHPDLLALHPAGPDGVLESFGRNVDTVVAAGAEYVDLTDGFSGQDFFSIIVINERGRRQITERLADELS